MQAYSNIATIASCSKLSIRLVHLWLAGVATLVSIMHAAAWNGLDVALHLQGDSMKVDDGMQTKLSECGRSVDHKSPIVTFVSCRTTHVDLLASLSAISNFIISNVDVVYDGYCLNNRTRADALEIQQAWLVSGVAKQNIGCCPWFVPRESLGSLVAPCIEGRLVLNHALGTM